MNAVLIIAEQMPPRLSNQSFCKAASGRHDAAE